MMRFQYEKRRVVEEVWRGDETILRAGHGGEQLSKAVVRPGDMVYRLVGEWVPEGNWPRPSADARE